MTAFIKVYAKFLEGLNAENLPTLADHVTPDVRFVDPFNDVKGVDHMTRVFAAVFAEVGPVQFSVTEAHGNFDAGMIAWHFEAQLRGEAWVFDGTSVLKFSSDGRVYEHIDHWDAAACFYARLPVIGWLLAALRRRLATS